MSTVNPIQANYAYPAFKGAEGQPSSSGSSPIVPAFLVGAATLGGVKMFAPGKTLEKGMDQDTFYSTLKEGKDVPFKKELEGEQKTTYENAKAAAKAEAPVTEEAPKTTEAPKAEAPKATPATPAPATTDGVKNAAQLQAENNKNIAISQYNHAVEKAQVNQGLTQNIQDAYNRVVTYDPLDKRVPMKAEDLKALQDEKSIIEESIRNKRAMLNAPGISNKDAIKAEIVEKQKRLGEINEKILSPNELRKANAKEIAEETSQNVKKARAELSAAEKEVTESAKAKTEAEKALNKAKSSKSTKEEIARLQAEFNEKTLAHNENIAKRNLKIKERDFHISINSAVEKGIKGDSLGMKRDLYSTLNKQNRLINADGTKGSLLAEQNLAKGKIKSAINDINKLEKRTAASAALDDEVAKIIGETPKKPAAPKSTAAVAETVADAGKTATKAATEGAEAAKKELPEFAKKAYESLKEVKLKSSWTKAGLWGAGALAATYIIAKVAGGGSKTEQA